jgi:Co/Zn/Cd efflux system component
MPSHSRGAMPGLSIPWFPPEKREWGMPGADAPAASCVSSRRRFTGNIPAFPHVNGFTTYSVLSPATNWSCHRHRRIGGLAGPGWADKTSARLDTSNGCQDHTASSSAIMPFVLRASIAHEVSSTRPAIGQRARHTAAHHIPPRVRDDRDTPLVWDETARSTPLIWGVRKQVYFCGMDWTGQITLKWLRKLVCAYADDNMRLAWICARNDVIGNLVVLLAAFGFFGTGAGWPDAIGAACLANLALQGAFALVRQSSAELRMPSA